MFRATGLTKNVLDRATADRANDEDPDCDHAWSMFYSATKRKIDWETEHDNRDQSVTNDKEIDWEVFRSAKNELDLSNGSLPLTKNSINSLFTFLENHSEISTLHLRWFFNATLKNDTLDFFLNCLTTNKTIKMLDISDNLTSLDDERLAHLITNNDTIQTLFMAATPLGSAFLKALGENRTITALDMSDNIQSMYRMERNENGKLKEHDHTKEFYQALKKNTTLTSLNLTTTITDRHLRTGSKNHKLIQGTLDRNAKPKKEKMANRRQTSCLSMLFTPIKRCLLPPKEEDQQSNHLRHGKQGR